jgi:hypothetical protein
MGSLRFARGGGGGGGETLIVATRQPLASTLFSSIAKPPPLPYFFKYFYIPIGCDTVPALRRNSQAQRLVG